MVQNKQKKTTLNDIDGVLEEFSRFGNYQILNLALICIPVVFNAILTLSYVFTASNLDYRCRVPECDIETSKYTEPWTNFTIPPNSKCSRYQLITNISTVGGGERNDVKIGVCSQDQFDHNKILHCNDVIYKTEEKTVANEWNLICPENEWKLTLIGSVNNVGQFIGIPVGGLISDRFGRRFVLVAGASISSVIGLIRSTSVNYVMFITLEFLDTLFGSIVYSAGWILSLELISTEKRALACTILSIFYSFGEMILGIAAKNIQNWRLLLRILYAPALIHITFIWLLPESIKWLMSKGKINETLKTLKKASKFNGQEESFAVILENLKSIDKTTATPTEANILNEKKSENIFKLIRSTFKSRKILWRIVNCSFCWFTNILVYYGLSLNSVSLAGDKYVNFILVCAMEIPGYLITYVIVDKVPRRISMCGTMLISGITLAMPIITGKGTLIMFLLGKIAITMSFTILYVYTTEMFPTGVRHSILSFCSMFGRIGSIIAPQTPLMAQIFPSLPLILFSACAIISGLLTLNFPETSNRNLPKDIQEAEFIEKNNENSQIAMDNL